MENTFLEFTFPGIHFPANKQTLLFFSFKIHLLEKFYSFVLACTCSSHMSKEQLDFDYASSHFELKILEKVNSHKDRSKDTNCQKREKHSLKYIPLINSSFHALIKSVGCGTILFGLLFSSADTYPRA